MGGYALIEELKALQEQYGLYLYFDDSHSISVYGNNGVGFIRDSYQTLHPRTIVVASLGKAFGATGGVVLLGNPQDKKMIDIFAGPMGWSQTANVAALGAINASVQIHLSQELNLLQQKLKQVMDYFDTQIPTRNANNNLPIRVVGLSEPEKAIEASKSIYDQGFYTSAVFFPILPRGSAGLRVMGRADLSENDIDAFCQALKSLS